MIELHELSLRHLQQHGMTATEAVAMQETFAKGQGRDIAWSQTAQSLPRALADRLDRVAVGWMMAHRATASPPGSAA
jgi:hypothetical protein